jgi:thiol-disulfide isomerase/thioredoxin
MPKKKTKRRHLKSGRNLKSYFLIGFFILVVSIVTFKERPLAFDPSAHSTLLAEEMLDMALEAGQPVLAFYHSTTCDQCLRMIATVNQVYPEFEELIALVDVNVHEEQNENLLRRERLQYIPTLIFYNRHGQPETHIGVMDAAELKNRLVVLSGGP